MKGSSKKPKTPKSEDLVNRMMRSATRSKPIKRTMNQAVEGKKVRYTMDMGEAQHKFLKQFALDTGTDSTVIMRILLSQLEQDAGLANKVKTQIVQLSN